jgi:hypothetical protein
VQVIKWAYMEGKIVIKVGTLTAKCLVALAIVFCDTAIVER